MLTQDLLQPLLTSISRTLSRDDGQEDAGAAAALLNAFHPQTPIQAMLAAQVIALHHAAMDCFAGAMETPAEDRPTITRLHRNAASLTRAFAATLRALQRDQAPHQTKAAKQAETAWQNPMQTHAPGLRPGGEPPAWPPQPPPSQLTPDQPASSQNAQQHPMQPESPGLRPGGEPALQPPPRPHQNRTEHPMQTHAPGLRPGGEEPAQRPPVQRPWELLTEAEQFAILYPDRVAAGATSHEDADLWLPRFTNPAHSTTRRANTRKPAQEPHAT